MLGIRLTSGLALFLALLAIKVSHPAAASKPPAPSCPSGIPAIGGLNSGSASPRFQGGFGRIVAIAKTGDLGKPYVLAVCTNGGAPPVLYFLFLDSNGVEVPGSALGPFSPAPSSSTAFRLAFGDVNADLRPDLVVGSFSTQQVFVYLMNSSLGYPATPSFTLNVPADSTPTASFGASIAVGNLDGDPESEIAVGAPSSLAGKNQPMPKVFVFNYSGSGFDLGEKLDITTLGIKSTDMFGSSLAIGPVTGAASLVVGIMNSDTGAPDAGAVAIFKYNSGNPGTLKLAHHTILQANPPIREEQIGRNVVVGNIDGIGDIDLVASSTYGNFTSRLVWEASPVLASGLFTHSLTADPTESSNGWGGIHNAIGVANIDGDTPGGGSPGKDDLLVGAPSDSCGAAYLFLNATFPPIKFVAPAPGGSWYGWSVAAASDSPGSPGLFVVGEPGRTVGGVTNAGQVYIYKLGP